MEESVTDTTVVPFDDSVIAVPTIDSLRVYVVPFVRLAVEAEDARSVDTPAILL